MNLSQSVDLVYFHLKTRKHSVGYVPSACWPYPMYLGGSAQHPLHALPPEVDTPGGRPLLDADTPSHVKPTPIPSCEQNDTQV